MFLMDSLQWLLQGRDALFIGPEPYKSEFQVLSSYLPRPSMRFNRQTNGPKPWNKHCQPSLCSLYKQSTQHSPVCIHLSGRVTFLPSAVVSYSTTTYRRERAARIVIEGARTDMLAVTSIPGLLSRCWSGHVRQSPLTLWCWLNSPQSVFRLRVTCVTWRDVVCVLLHWTVSFVCYLVNKVFTLHCNCQIMTVPHLLLIFHFTQKDATTLFSRWLDEKKWPTSDYFLAGHTVFFDMTSWLLSSRP